MAKDFYAIFAFLAFRDRFGFFLLALHLYSSILLVCDSSLKTGCHGTILIALNLTTKSTFHFT